MISLVTAEERGTVTVDFSFDRSLGFVINRAAGRLAVALEQALAPHGVTAAQWALLNRLWEEDGLSQKELAERTFRDPPNTTRMLDKLERKGLVRRAPDPTDRRVTLIYLTEVGRQLKPVLIPLARAVLARASDGITAEEQATLLRLLDRLTRNLD